MLKKDEGYYVKTPTNYIGPFGTCEWALQHIKKIGFKNIEYKIVFRTTIEHVVSTIKMGY